jgi:hypothetical protein
LHFLQDFSLILPSTDYRQLHIDIDSRHASHMWMPIRFHLASIAFASFRRHCFSLSPLSMLLLFRRLFFFARSRRFLQAPQAASQIASRRLDCSLLRRSRRQAAASQRRYDSRRAAFSRAADERAASIARPPLAASA